MSIQCHDFLHENRPWLHTKRVFKWTLALPWTALHRQLSKLTVPAAHNQSFMHDVCPKQRAVLDSTVRVALGQILSQTELSEEGQAQFNGYTVTPIQFQVGLTIVDAVKLTKSGNTRWAAIAGGNGETLWSAPRWTGLLGDLEANAVIMSYSGLKEKSQLVKAYRQVLHFIEEQSTERLLIGHSLGGGVMRSALKQHKLRSDGKYIALFDRTFSTLPEASLKIVGGIRGKIEKMDDLGRCGGCCCGCMAGFVQLITRPFMWLMGWSLGSVGVSGKMHREGVRQHIIDAENDNVILPGARLGEKKHAQMTHYWHDGAHNDEINLTGLGVTDGIMADFAKDRVIQPRPEQH